MSNLNKVGIELVLELINRDNRTTFTFDDILLSPPVALAVTADFRNTKTTVSAKPYGKYRGQETVAYWRLDLARLFVDPNNRVNGEGVTNTLELLDRINARYGTLMTADDVIVEDIDTTILPITYTLKTLPGSFAYIGQVDIDLRNALEDLGEVIEFDIMAGVEYPVDPELKEGGLTFVDESGNLLSAPGVSQDPMTNTNNGEIEIYTGVHLSDVGVKLMPEAGVYEFDFVTNDRWYLDVGFGLLPGARAGNIEELYDIDVSIIHALGGNTLMQLVRQPDDIYGWSIDGSIPSIDLGYQEDNVLADTLESGWFTNEIPLAEIAESGSLVGDFTVVVRATPIKSIQVSPLEIRTLVKARIIG